MSKGSKRRNEIDYVQFCKNWDKIFNSAGSGRDSGAVPPPEKGHRSSVHKSGEGVKAEIKGR